MHKRVLLAGLLGGLSLFIWEFVAHDLSPLGEAGFKTLPDQQSSMAAMKATVQESGFYIFPGLELKPGMSDQEKQKARQDAMTDWAKGPSGLILIHRHGGPSNVGAKLGVQAAADFAVILLAAFFLSQLPTSLGFGGRLLAVLSMSLIPLLRTGLPYWNWYGFPKKYIAAQFLIDVIGFGIAGLIAAKLVQSRPKTIAAAS